MHYLQLKHLNYYVLDIFVTMNTRSQQVTTILPFREGQISFISRWKVKRQNLPKIEDETKSCLVPDDPGFRPVPKILLFLVKIHAIQMKKF